MLVTAISFAYLEKPSHLGFDDTNYGRQVTISAPVLEMLVSRFNVHSAFLFDLLGRPDYWSAVTRTKEEDASVQMGYGDAFKPLSLESRYV
jgi:hypothetical protein